VPSLFGDSPVDHQELFETAPKRWINTIRVTPPRASTRPAEELAEYVGRRFLRTAVPQRRRRDRRWVRAAARETVVSALASAGVPNPGDIVKRRVIDGSIEPHEFDVTVENGRLALAALALSFEKQGATDLQREYSSAAWAIEDVHRSHPELPLAVVMLPPASGTSKTYEQARKVFSALDAEPVETPELDEWAADIAESFVRAAR
jgi:hypothetical protein